MAVPYLACMALVAQTYSLPPRVLPSIQAVEGGGPGTVYRNTDGSDDLGVMQINTLWLPTLSRYTRLDPPEVRDRLLTFVSAYGERREGEPEALRSVLLKDRPGRPFDLLRDLHDLWLAANESLISLTALGQAAQALRDEGLEAALELGKQRNERQREWLMTRIKVSAPQVLVVPS